MYYGQTRHPGRGRRAAAYRYTPRGRSSQSDLASVRRRHLAAQLRLRRANCVGRHEPPTPVRLLELWAASRESLEGKIILGAALGDLEAAVDNSHIRDECGEVVGRKPGIRGWIDQNCPSLHNRYKTLMRYKAMADKFRLVAETQADMKSDETAGIGPNLVDAVIKALQGPDPAQGSPVGAKAAVPVRLPSEARVRALLIRSRTLVALDEALWAALCLVRTRRKPRRAA